MAAAVLHFSATTEARGLVFVSGQLGFAPGAATIEGEVGEQTRRCLANLAEVLRTRGLTLRDVVKTTVFLRDAADFAAFNAAYAGFFGEHKPARSTVVAAPVRADALIEIEAIAAAR